MLLNGVETILMVLFCLVVLFCRNSLFSFVETICFFF
jgi:hypothetical protein